MLLLVQCSNRKISVKKYEITTEKISSALRVVVVTDLHSCYYGENQEDLLGRINELKPDLILLGGDIVDDVLPRKNSLIFLEAIGKVYPCFYVSGNHELRSGKLDEIKTIIRNFNIAVLEGDTKRIVLKEQTIQICGIDDFEIGESIHKLQLEQINQERDRSIYTILIDHRPEHISKYINDEFDLIVSGHAHGGQWRLPGLLNGLYAPNQGLFPKYAGGLYSYDKTLHVVSRGLAKESTRIPRLFNPPELVVVDIKSTR